MLRLLKTLERAKASERVRELAYIVAKAALSPTSQRGNILFPAGSSRRSSSATIPSGRRRKHERFWRRLRQTATLRCICGVSKRSDKVNYLLTLARCASRSYCHSGGVRSAARKTVEPKTKASLRGVDVAEDVGRVVQEHRERMKREGTVLHPMLCLHVCNRGRTTLR